MKRKQRKTRFRVYYGRHGGRRLAAFMRTPRYREMLEGLQGAFLISVRTPMCASDTEFRYARTQDHGDPTT